MVEQRFLHIIDTTGPGGAETIFTQLAFKTQSLNYKTIALIRGPGWVQSELERLGIDTRIFDCKGSFNFKFLFYIISIVRREKITVIQSHLLGSNVYASIAGKICGVRVFTTFHGFVDISTKEKFSALKFSAIRWGAEKVIAVTQQIKDMLIEVSALNEKQVLVVANGVDTVIFSSPESDYRISPDRPVKIGCLGNVRNAKNYPLAISALKKLREKHYNVELYIAGDNQNKLAASCVDLAKELGVVDHLHWLGFMSNAPEYLRSLDLFLLSSSSEGHPLALTQAMAVGLPIAATKCGIEGVVIDRETALLAENGDLSSVVRVIEELINSDDLRKALGLAAVAEANAKWSLDSTFNNYLALYQC